MKPSRFLLVFILLLTLPALACSLTESEEPTPVATQAVPAATATEPAPTATQVPPTDTPVPPTDTIAHQRALEDPAPPVGAAA